MRGITKKPILSLQVDIYSGSLSEAGHERLADAIYAADLENGIFEFVLHSLQVQLPKEADDAVDWFTLSVKEQG